MDLSQSRCTAFIVLLSCSTILRAQAPPPDIEQIQKDAELLLEDLKSHQLQLEQEAVDDLTIQLQDEILTVWDRLLDHVDQNKKKPQSKSSQNPQPQNQDPNQQPQEQDPSSQQQPQSQQPMGQQPMPERGGEEPEPAPGGNEAGEGQESNQPADRASEETRERQQSRLLQMQQAERERLMKEVWGKLPKRIRQKLLNASDEQYLPAYEERIREYFRKLSEPESR